MVISSVLYPTVVQCSHFSLSFRSSQAAAASAGINITENTAVDTVHAMMSTSSTDINSMTVTTAAAAIAGAVGATATDTTHGGAMPVSLSFEESIRAAPRMRSNSVEVVALQQVRFCACLYV